MDAPPTINVRLSRQWLTLIAGSGLVAIALQVVIFGLSDAPLFAPVFIGLGALPAVGRFALLASGPVPCLKVAPDRMKQLGCFDLEHMLTQRNRSRRTVHLYPGGALVATSGELLIWRYYGEYDRIRIRSAHANPEDWERLRTWAASKWPQPPDYSHRSAIVR